MNPPPSPNQPLSGNAMPRFGGVATMMRLPTATTAAGLDATFVGVPLDIGTSHRPGTRFGPRAIRAESALIRPYNMATGAAPFDALQVADLGDVPINTYSLEKSVEIITGYYRDLQAQPGRSGRPVRPLTLGGDHTIALPILRAMAERHGPVALIHVDAHADVNEDMFGERIAHGTPFRRAVEEGLLRNDKVWQIGLRGSGYAADDFDWPRRQGFTIVPAHEVWWTSLAPLLDRIRAAIGPETPCYLSFDIDGIDPAYAGGTGDPSLLKTDALIGGEWVAGDRRALRRHRPGHRPEAGRRGQPGRPAAAEAPSPPPRRPGRPGAPRPPRSARPS
jgi:guanidinobutyrase